MSQRNKQNPTTWDSYQRGRTSSFGSLGSVPENQHQRTSIVPTAGRADDGGNEQDDGQDLRRRRSSIAMRINTIRQMGGPNSIDNFAKSWQRAATFRDIAAPRRSSISVTDEEQPILGRGSATTPSPQQKSLLRQQLEAAGEHGIPENAIQDSGEPSEATEQTSLLPAPNKLSKKVSLPAFVHSSIGGASLGQSYGSISSRLTVKAQRRASVLIAQQREASMRALESEDAEDKDLFVPTFIEQEVRPDGEVIERLCGESTVPMTIFNSTNVLIGVGILALPLGLKYSGWVIGLTSLTLVALLTQYTAKLLAKCLDTNSGSTTYGDIAYLAFDTIGRNFVETIFVLELNAANVALVILFADSMHSLFPSISVIGWKFVLALGLIPGNFVPFKYLSITSIFGIVATLGIVSIVFADGLIKPDTPGSLREVAKTYAFPKDFRTIPLSVGLFMAPWGGHSVFPAIYRDMRHPKKYGKAVSTTYAIAYGLDMPMAVMGYLMFGELTRDEITANILDSYDYPHILGVIMVTLIAIIPITKLPLSNRPISDTINKKFLIDLRQMDAKARRASEKNWKHRLARGSIAVSANIIQLCISILLPDFDSVMALMGSALCLTICLVLPALFYLKIFSSEGNEISRLERIGCYVLIVVASVLAVLGTVFAIIPKEKIGAK